MSVLSNAELVAQADQLQKQLDSAAPEVIQKAVATAAHATRETLAKAAPPFDSLPPRDRTKLYLTLIYTLAILAAGALIGGAIALVNGVDSAAFFTFAGLALGGLTGLFATSPTSGK